MAAPPQRAGGWSCCMHCSMLHAVLRAACCMQVQARYMQAKPHTLLAQALIH
jgi:hypothetical protein